LISADRVRGLQVRIKIDLMDNKCRERDNPLG
jgi:hypothetical protein